MTDPKLYLAVDNCFAYKRWVKPIDWMNVVRDMGLYGVEQSADTECDPLYDGADYMKEWIDLVLKASDKTGVRVKNIYSGHGTYASTGMTHWHDGVRLRFRDEWMKPQADAARALDAGFGFFAHGFEHNMLQSPAIYQERLNLLYDDLSELARYAQSIGLRSIGLEQMYTPHMPPWTIEGTETLIRSVYDSAQAPMYITLDLGHMNGQQYFLKPSEETIISSIEARRRGEDVKRPWIGTQRAHEIYASAQRGDISAAEAARRIVDDMDENPQLFCQPVDGDIWQWVEHLGVYSPIVHLQQTDGKSSPHWPFSEKYNRIGVASGEKLIESLWRSFHAPSPDDGPKPVGEIVLTLEPFVGTAADPYEALDDIAESVTYWRRFVPRDGMTLSEAHALLA